MLQSVEFRCPRDLAARHHSRIHQLGHTLQAEHVSHILDAALPMTDGDLQKIPKASYLSSHGLFDARQFCIYLEPENHLKLVAGGQNCAAVRFVSYSLPEGGLNSANQLTKL